jgi:hypothetical protein
LKEEDWTPPVIYEVNTWVWLTGLTAKYKRRIDLSCVPPDEWNALAELDCNAVWLMGVWQRSPQGRQIALHHRELMAECRRILPDFHDSDLPGSPYSIKSYTVDSRLGDLAIARSELARRGLRLILDFVPNHVARDHEWVLAHPEFFIQGNEQKSGASPGSYFKAGSTIIACGRDPHYPAWTDTAQLNAFSPQLRAAALQTLRHIASQCDGVRCDMAMLLLNDVFAKTWADAAGPAPASEFWADLIGGVRQTHSQFLFIAEAYWDREADLQKLGFDYAYDKRLYDRFMHGDAQSIRDHLKADITYQNKLIRFLENHDEARVAAVLPPDRLRAAAVACALLPGGTLYYQGQFCGSRIHLPVQLGRAPSEPCDGSLADFYAHLRRIAAEIKSSGAAWQLCDADGWPDNQSANQLLCWTWQEEDNRYVAVINYANSAAQARIHLPWSSAKASAWILRDLLTGERYERDAAELERDGLYVARPAWGYHLLVFEAR